VLLAALTAAGKADEAIAAGRQLLELDPTDPVTVSLLGRALERSGKASEAAACARELERLCGGDAELRKAVEADLRWLRGQQP
jgi:cytochrome c-type biogenesis protein CcmH/NrfG